MHIDIPIQPQQPVLSIVQKAKLKTMRNSSILYTILGQKILFSSISRFLLRISPEYRISETLKSISSSVTKMDEKGFFDRNSSQWSHVLVQDNEKLQMITKGSGAERCIDLVRMILLDSPDGVRELIKKTKEEVSSQVHWTESVILNWRKEFHVILPEVAFIDEEIKESSESDDSFAEVRNLLDSTEEDEDEDESAEIEHDEDIFKEIQDLV